MPLESLVSAALLSAAKEAGSAAVRRLTKEKSKPDRTLSQRLEAGLSDHLRYVVETTSRVHLFGTSIAEATDSATVPLTINDLPRRFRSATSNVQILTEQELRVAAGNYALLGDPGAGKTTTAKRLAQALLTTEPHSSSDVWGFPILITCREHDWTKDSLSEILCSLLRVPNPLPETLTQTVIREDLAYAVLDEGPAMLIIDGLDEVPASQRTKLERDIERFANRGSLVKVIASCRSGDYRHLDGFSVLELCPLDETQIDTVAGRWLGSESANFLEALRASTVADLASRPLFLAQLLIVYRNSGGFIPDQPASLYRRITRLLLQDWDEQRRVARSSAYSRFQVDDKLEFLSALSYELTVERQSIRFTRENLVTLYERVAPKFGLPPKEAGEVARELETHTGIIVESGDSFEFSHLSLQEYLCAYYMVREPFDDMVARYLHNYPEPVAVAVSLSSDPSQWMASVVLRAGVLNDYDQVRSFVYRLGREKPRFSVSARLGHAVLKLMAKAGPGSVTFFEDLACNDQVLQSVDMVVDRYTWHANTNGQIRAIAKAGSRAISHLGAGVIDREVVALLAPAVIEQHCPAD